MKVIIDLIEDIRTVINNDREFSLSAMGLHESINGEFTPVWQSNICKSRVDEKEKRLLLFLGKEKAMRIGEILEMLDLLDNEKMMYDINISYLRDEARIDGAVIGFGESIEDKTYLLFISE